MKTKRNKHNFIILMQSLCCRWDLVVIISLTLCLISGGLWGLQRHIPKEELIFRKLAVQTAESCLGANESDGSHEEIIDCYNSADALPRNYVVTYEDNWCATFVTAVAMRAGLTDIIPPECSCEQQIRLLDAMDCWQEDERYLPQPGDLIYYVWDEWRNGDCTAWAAHVGIVVETFGPVIKVIEGNKNDAVGYRYIFLNDITIRGFGIPDYGNLMQ